jgi:hypothetical protein
MWYGVSRLASHSLYVADEKLVGSRRLLSLLRKHWPVIQQIALSSVSVLCLIRAVDLMIKKVGKIILVCLYSDDKCHIMFNFLLKWDLTIFFKWDLGSGVCKVLGWCWCNSGGCCWVPYMAR